MIRRKKIQYADLDEIGSTDAIRKGHHAGMQPCPLVTLPRSAKRNRNVLIRSLDSFSPEVREQLRHAALANPGSKRTAPQSTARRTRRRTDSGPCTDAMDVDDLNVLVDGPFFRPPTEEEQNGAIVRSIERTGNAALTKHICMVCARKLFTTELVEMAIMALPNKRHLVPMYAHPAHRLVNGCLLHDEAVDAATTYLCLECRAKLLKDERPPFALANGMWLGRVPFELQVLTLPERLLIALYFPAVYVVKLYPKVPGARFWDKRTVNTGMRGNVSTYRLNSADIADIVAGVPKTLPPSPHILAATIGVTFVGRGNRPLTVLPDFLRVRRQRVLEALVWLKANNPLYATIQIDDHHLSLLPENDVPEEIMSNTRLSQDVNGLQREHGGYVPLDVAEEEPEDVTMETVGAAAGVEPVVNDDDEMTDDFGYSPPVIVAGEAVFPLQAHGVLDVQADGVPDNDVAAHGFANAASEFREKSFKIRRDSAFVNEYARVDANGQRFDGGPSNPNHMLGAFPTLFPYGKGGFEVERDVDVPYESHARWALQYSDGRFRKDLYFIFQAFGVVQKREVCRSAGLQVKRSTFIANQVAFMKLQPRDLLKASAEETRRVPFSNPVIRKLRKHLTSLRSRVPGTDESRISVRSQIWGMNLRFNPPSIWATINLADTSDPVAQVLAGKDIDMDRFIATAGPDREARAINVASDPYAAAEFFHYMVRVLLEEAFGIKIQKKGKFDRRPGIVGLVNGYIGTVEAQGRGTLHLHILFWLAGSPSSAAMQAALQAETFREKIIAFIKQTVRADIHGLDAETILSTKKKSSIAYSRPEDPREPNYSIRRREAEANIARAVQVHDCKPWTCLVTKGGRSVCKRRAPFPLAADDWVLPSGEWGPRRLCGRLNSWNPALLQIIRANQDIKLMTNGYETKDIAFYITLYIAKKQIQCSNASALLAKSLAFQRKLSARSKDARDVNRRMITQCANTLSRQQELSGPEVVSYLMGWGDRYISHHFVPIYWDEITGALKRTFPQLQQRSALTRLAGALGETAPTSEAETRDVGFYRPLNLQQGVFVLKDQPKEYTDRGHELDDMNFHDYFIDTYHGSMLTARMDEDAQSGDENAPHPRRQGRPASRRVPYLPESRRKRAAESSEDRFVGTWFPRSDAGDYYYACMLALLKPWRTLRDLKPPERTFAQEFEDLMAGANDRVKRIVANVAYYHECVDGAKRNKEAALAPPAGFVDVNDYVRRDQELEELNDLHVERTEDDVQHARENRYQYRDWLYGEHAMSVARDVGVFTDEPLQPEGPLRAVGTYEDTLKYAEWGKKVTLLTRQDVLRPANVLAPPTDADLTVRIPRPFTAAVIEELPDRGRVRTPEQAAAIDILNVEQRRAHDIIESHARRTLAGVRQEQLLMIVRGEGGTGKTVLLNALAHTFEFLGAADALAKTATTGVAASLVGGQTLHSWAGLRVRDRDSEGEEGPRSKPTHTTAEKRKKNIIPAKYLDIDECSMLTKQLLATLSQVVGEFNTVVTLTEQKRITDLPWKALLGRLRYGACTEDDINMLRSLLVTEGSSTMPDWSTDPWRNAALVTPRHSVRTRWNTAALTKHCARAKQRLYICQAEDVVGREGTALNLEQRIIVAGMSVKQTGKLAERVELAIGMRAMVLMNISTEADLANGTRGEVVDFVLDPREPVPQEVDNDTGAIMLKYPPVVVLFKPDTSSFPPFEGLPDGVLPIVPSKMVFAIRTSSGQRTASTLRDALAARTPGKHDATRSSSATSMPPSPRARKLRAAFKTRVARRTSLVVDLAPFPAAAEEHWHFHWHFHSREVPFDWGDPSSWPAPGPRAPEGTWGSGIPFDNDGGLHPDDSQWVDGGWNIPGGFSAPSGGWASPETASRPRREHYGSRTVYKPPHRNDGFQPCTIPFLPSDNFYNHDYHSWSTAGEYFIFECYENYGFPEIRLYTEETAAVEGMHKKFADLGYRATAVIKENIYAVDEWLNKHCRTVCPYHGPWRPGANDEPDDGLSEIDIHGKPPKPRAAATSTTTGTKPMDDEDELDCLTAPSET
ncbi:hypothetical protein B0H11DRAFT_1917799 [Mycena galericulata]|nr:hypothetical protein B0H11DRAFT_1917799 [Mycena galericulata]